MIFILRFIIRFFLIVIVAKQNRPALKLVKLVVNSFLAIGAAWASRKAAGETVFQEYNF
jgi:hypothetical protein